METRVRASSEQFALMLEFMEKHGDLSRAQPGLQGRIASDRLWQELTDLLNSAVGRGVKTTDKWKKVWTDWKTKTKKKAITMNRDQRVKKPLNPLENKVLRVIRAHSATKQKESGLKEASQAKQQTEENAVNTEEQNPFNTEEQNPLNIEEQNPLKIEEQNPLNIEEQNPLNIEEQNSLNTEEQNSLNTELDEELVDIGLFATDQLSSPPDINIQEERLPTPQHHRRRRRIGETPFQRAASEFAAIEKMRLQLERQRQEHLFELEKERLRIEAVRVDIEKERVQVEKKRIQVESGRLQNEIFLRQSLDQLNLLLSNVSTSKP